MIPNHTPQQTRTGLYYALACYAIWGLFPLYWYPLNQSPIDAPQLLAQRIVWSAVFALALIAAGRQTHELAAALRQSKTLALFALSAFSISMNWLVYLWAVVHHHILDASLGYFVSPLFNILLGRLVFGEKLNCRQSAALILALCGILWLAVPAGKIPWVAILLTLSFGIYGLVRKTAPLGALPGLVLETLLMLPFAAAYLLYVQSSGKLVFAELTALQTALLIGSGVITTVPLLLFAASARRIPLSTLGIIQYGSPTIQFLLGLFVFGETFDRIRFLGYILVWIGVALYVSGLLQNRQKAV